HIGCGRGEILARFSLRPSRPFTASSIRRSGLIFSVSSRQNRAVNIDELSINTIRTLSMDAVQKAESGHPGTPMALAPLAYKLFIQHMKHDPADPSWFDRDRFVLSAGHASMLLYSSLFLSGYDLSLDDLKQFRQWESRTPGHPEYGY